MAAKAKHIETSTEGTAAQLRNTICRLDGELYIARKNNAEMLDVLKREQATVGALQREVVRLLRELEEANDIPF
ncbi:MAG: hypothetical protein LCH39_01950 [Proteobacteria bacterium]|nr:hypothetical protein [Pseudomonadota bacterium]